MDIADATHDFCLQPGPRDSIWRIGIEPGGFSSLQQDLQVDVVIVGAGITGITAATQLSRAGRSVAVLEAHSVGAGTTGNSTGNLYATVDQRLHQLVRKWGQEKVRLVVESRVAAINLIERFVAEYQLRCDFSRQPWVLYSTEGLADESADIEEEFQATQAAGLDARLALDLPLPYMIRKALVLRNQAQFHPLQYVRQLAAAVQSATCRIFEHAPVSQIDEQHHSVLVGKHIVSGRHLILATHVPKGGNVVQAGLGPYREYAVAAAVLNDQLPGGMFWSAGAKPTSTRTLRIAGQSYVLMIGEKHKTGQNAEADLCYQTLEARLQARFHAQPVSFKWSAQHYRAADGLPYIGASSRSAQTYIASGFGADGLTYGTLAGLLLANQICGIDNPWAELYDPARFTPIKSARNFFKENLNVASQYLKDYVKSPEVDSPDQIACGCGALTEINGSKVAAYRDDANHLYLLSPICTHLRCVVHWNRAERSWDCPCHGSRFQYDGQVIEGPALAPLAPFDPTRRNEGR